MFDNDSRIVMTLDAGGTNLVFSAIRGNVEIAEPVTLPSDRENLENCLKTIKEGFELIRSGLAAAPCAISFAFPGPADYENGVIGDLPNFPSFRGGVALKGYLEEHFGIPVFINNDGNLFAYGEAISGALPHINSMLSTNRRYGNLLGITLGTGFGAGVVIDGTLLKGDNGCGGDIWNFRNKLHPEMIAEESVSIRAVTRVYNELTGNHNRKLSPKDIFSIAEGAMGGNASAAREAFRRLGEAAGDAISHAVTIVDGIIVIGGGLTGASKYIFPAIIEEMSSDLSMFSGERFPRVQSRVFNYLSSADMKEFLAPEDVSVTIPGTDKSVPYTRLKRTLIMPSILGTSRAVSLGAYAFALARLDKA